MADLLSLMHARGFSPRKAGTQYGGEYSSPCPGPICKGEGENRFHIWPNRETGGKSVGKFWCRQCEKTGDTIEFLQWVDGLSFIEACTELGISLPQHQGGPVRTRYQAPPEPPKEPMRWEPKVYSEPGPVWQAKAANLMADCQARLSSTPVALAWLAARGIPVEAARAYGLGYNLSSKGKDRYRARNIWGLPEKIENGKAKRLWIPRGWVIPAHNQDGAIVQLRIRRLNEDVESFCGNIRYLPIDGSSMATMVLHPAAEVFAVVESGFDAVLLAWLLGGKIGVMTTWNSSARPDARAHALLAKSSLILGALDYDGGGDREQDWWQSHYRQYRRLHTLPFGAKDPGDAAKDGADVRAWLIDGMPRGLQIKLDLVPRRKPIAKVEELPVAPVSGASKASPAETESVPDLIEIELVSGKVVYVTDNPALWQELASQGNTVFSRNELERLRTAVASLSAAERIEAVLQAVEAKEIFGGYIQAGRGGITKEVQNAEHGEDPEFVPEQKEICRQGSSASSGRDAQPQWGQSEALPVPGVRRVAHDASLADCGAQ